MRFTGIPAHGEREKAAEQVEAAARPPGYDDPPAGVAVTIFRVVELRKRFKNCIKVAVYKQYLVN